MSRAAFTVIVLIYNFLGIYCFDFRESEQWKYEYPECGGKQQSPINIDLISNKTFIPKLLQLKGFEELPTEMTVVNNGHSAQFEGKWPADKVPSVFGGPLESNYLFDSFHFHWGQINSRGSEHTYNGKQFPLEMHLVHYKSDYGSLKNAMHKSDGLVIFGIMFQLTAQNSSELENVARSLPLVKQKGEPVPIKPFPLSKFKLNKERYFITYHGALTTPPCPESATWLMAGNIHSITQNQLDAFRELELDNGMKDTYRPIQPLNGRTYSYVRLRN